MTVSSLFMASSLVGARTVLTKAYRYAYFTTRHTRARARTRLHARVRPTPLHTHTHMHTVFGCHKNNAREVSRTSVIF